MRKHAINRFTMSTKKYLPNLDSLRGIAAILVIVSHFEQLKGHKNIAHLTNWTILGSTAVTIFFVLGGFLSTYFLINEKLKTGSINYQLFYSKRYIRIWPLYFILLAISFFWWPAHMGYEYLLLCIFMMSNVAFAMFGLNVVIDPIWTLGAEDQYYIFHPQLFRFKNFKTIFYSFIGLMLIYIAIRYGVKWFLNVPAGLRFFLDKTRFDNFLLGGIGAFVYYKSQKLIAIPHLFSLQFIFQKWVQIVLAVLLVLYFAFSTFINPLVFSELLFSLLLMPLILNLALNDNCILAIETKWLNFIGKISFSLYLSHKMILYWFLVWCKKQPILRFIKASPYNHLLLYPIIMCITIGVAWLLYTYVEKNILLWKEKLVKQSAAQ